MPKSVVGVLRPGASPDDTAATLARVLGCEGEIRGSRAALVLLPEALLGGYPRGKVGGAGFAATVAVPGPEVDALASVSARTGASLVVGVVERAGSTLYRTALFLDPVEGLLGTHRKLVPSACQYEPPSERDDPFTGGSVIVGPLGDVPAGRVPPVRGQDARPGVSFRSD